MAKKAIFVMLLIWATPLCVKGTEIAETNASKTTHNLQENLESKAKDKPINKDADEHKKESGSMPKNDTEDTCMIKAQRLQYTQLLEIHRSYFTIYLQVLAIYMAVMGACIKLVAISIGKIKNKEKDVSKTILFTLTAFALIASFLFGKGIIYGYGNAVSRSSQIVIIASQLGLIPINVELLQNLFFMMFFGVAAIIILWAIMIIRGIMVCVEK